MNEKMTYAIIQDGNCIWGTGETIDDCIRDANKWLDSDQQILVFEAHDQRGREPGGLTDWTSGRRYQMAGDLFITDDPTVIAEYTPSLHESEWDAFVSNCSRYKRHD